MQATAATSGEVLRPLVGLLPGSSFLSSRIALTVRSTSCSTARSPPGNSRRLLLTSGTTSKTLRLDECRERTLAIWDAVRISKVYSCTAFFEALLAFALQHFQLTRHRSSTHQFGNHCFLALQRRATSSDSMRTAITGVVCGLKVSICRLPVIQKS